MSGERALVERAVHWAAVEEGSTRVLGLLRVVVPMVMWASFSAKLLLWRQLPGGTGRGGLGWDEGLWTLVVAVPFYVFTAMMCLGVYSRFSSLMSGLCVWGFVAIPGWVFGQLQWMHHYVEIQIFTALLLAAGPCGASFSVDSARARARGEVVSERGPLTAQRLIALMLATMYFWAAVDKLRAPFLNGEELGRLVLYYYTDSDWPAWSGFQPLMAAFGVGTVLLELALAVGLWFARMRVPLVLAGVALHVGIYFTLEVYTFTLSTVLLYVVFFPPQRVHELVGGWLGLAEDR
jgi:hypothetical protein